MRKLMLFLLLLGLQSEARAEGRIAVTGVPVVGGYRTLYTSPPGEEPQYDDYGRPVSVPYAGTHYARNLPGQLTLGQGRIEGKPWYFNANGYNSYHYGEHYQPTGGLHYAGHPDAIGYWYPSLWQSAGYCGDSWYDPRLYAPPSGGWSHAPSMREMWVPIDRKPTPSMSVTTRSATKRKAHATSREVKSDVGYYTVPDGKWADDGRSFTDGNDTKWVLVAGGAVDAALRSSKVKGYLVTVIHLDGSEKTYLHFVEWVDRKWKPTGQIWE